MHRIGILIHVVKCQWSHVRYQDHIENQRRKLTKICHFLLIAQIATMVNVRFFYCHHCECERCSLGALSALSNAQQRLECLDKSARSSSIFIEADNCGKCVCFKQCRGLTAIRTLCMHIVRLLAHILRFTCLVSPKTDGNINNNEKYPNIRQYFDIINSTTTVCFHFTTTN